MISVTATVLRDGEPQELPVAQLVPGDVVKLAAGDMIPGGRADRRGQGSVRHPGLADRRDPSPSRSSRSTRAPSATVAPRARQHRLPRHQRRERLRDGRRRRDRAARPTSASMAASLAEQPTADRVRQGRRALHLADAPLHAGHGAAGLRHQRPDQGQLARGVLLRPRRRRRPDARDAADDRDGLSVQGRHGHGPQEGDRQAAQRHPEPRRDGRALHRQDRHADDGPGDPGARTATSS